MSEIKPGAKVRVTFEGEYHSHCKDPDCKGFKVGGYGVPLHASVEVVAPPLPPEPPVGEYVERYGDVYKNVGPEGWWNVGSVSAPYTWAELCAGGPVTRLYRADDPEITVREGAQ